MDRMLDGVLVRMLAGGMLTDGMLVDGTLADGMLADSDEERSRDAGGKSGTNGNDGCGWSEIVIDDAGGCEAFSGLDARKPATWKSEIEERGG